jgi:soluble P-type ATPase
MDEDENSTFHQRTKKKKNHSSNQFQQDKQEIEIFNFFHSLYHSSLVLSSPTSSHFSEWYYMLQLLLLAEMRSSHPLAKGITSYCRYMVAIMEKVIQREGNSAFFSSVFLPNDEDLSFEMIPGQGILMKIKSKTTERTDQDNELLIGNADLLINKGNITNLPSSILNLSNGFTAGGKVPLYFSFNGQLKGIISLSDKVRPETAYVLRELKNRGIQCYMVTGDQYSTALAIGSSLGLSSSQILASVKPEEKELFIAALQQKGKKVAFIGDGTNDGPALARANVGITMASGSDIAVEAGDMLLVKNDLTSLITALDLASRTLWRIKLNYLWAFGYNICLIPIAAGVFFPFFHFALQPMWAGAAMALSSVSIVLSSLTIAFFVPKAILPSEKSLSSSSSSFFSFLFASSSSSSLTPAYRKIPVATDENSDYGAEGDDECRCPVSMVPDLDEEQSVKLLEMTSMNSFTGRLSKRLFSDDAAVVLSAQQILQQYKDQLKEQNQQDHKINPSVYGLHSFNRDSGDEELGFHDPLASYSSHPLIVNSSPRSVTIPSSPKAGCGCCGKNCRCGDNCSCSARKQPKRKIIV